MCEEGRPRKSHSNILLQAVTPGNVVTVTPGNVVTVEPGYVVTVTPGIKIYCKTTYYGYLFIPAY